MKKLFQAAIRQSTIALTRIGFRPPQTNSPERISGVLMYCWERKKEWTVDRVRLSLPNGERRVDIDFSVLHPKEIGGMEDGAEIYPFVSEYVGEVRPRGLLALVSSESFEERVEKLISGRISWFDRFHSPKGCLSYVSEQYSLDKNAREMDCFKGSREYFSSIDS